MKIKIKKPTRGGHADSYFDEENARRSVTTSSLKISWKMKRPSQRASTAFPITTRKEQKKPKAKKRRG